MRTALLTVAIALLVAQAHAAGFTKAELDALPKPDPNFFSDTKTKKPAAHRPQQGSSAAVTARAAAKSVARKRRMASRIEQPDWGMIQVQALAARVWRNSGMP